MSTDFDVDALGGIEMNVDWEKWSDPVKESEKDFQDRIFSPPNSHGHFERKEGFKYVGQPSEEILRADTLVKDRLEITSTRNSGHDREPGWGGEIGGRATFGGDGGVRYEAYVKAEGHDDNGNYCGGSVSRNDKGETTVESHAGHKSD